MLPVWHSRAVFIISSFRMCTFPCYDQCYPVSVCQTMLEPVGMYCLFNGCSEGLGRPCIMVIACWCGEGLCRPCIMVIIGCCMFHFDSGVTPSWWMVYLSGASHCTVCENMSGASHRTVCENMIGDGWCRIPAIKDIAGDVWVNSSPPGQNGCHFAANILRCILWMKSSVFCLKFHCSLFLRIQLTITELGFR